jgi:biopolymer transport protein ExbD
MAGIDVGGGSSGRKSVVSDINMIPFIDLLFVTIAFLLITAAWSAQSRIEANTQAPSSGDGPVDTPPPERALHVTIEENRFAMTWKQASTVIRTAEIPRVATRADAVGPRYPELAHFLETEWAAEGIHRDPSDRRLDHVVLHTDDKMPFKEIVAVLDAIAAPHRDLKSGDGVVRRVSAFEATFATH